MKKLTIIIMTAALFVAASCEKQEITTAANEPYNVEPLQKVGQIIEKAEGWQGISFNIEMADMDAQAFMSQYPDIVIIKTMGGKVCWRMNDDSYINTIGDLNCLQGYQMYSEAAVEITVEGEYTSATMPATMPSGWSMWGMPYIYPTYPTDAYNMPNPPMQCDVIKHVPTGAIFWEILNINQIGLLAPNEAYMVHIDDGDGWTHKQIEEYNGLQRIKPAYTKHGDTCGICLKPSYYDAQGNLCDKENAVMYLDEERGVVWL